MQKTRLPEAFLEDMKALLGPDYDAFLLAMEERPLSGLRVNTLKAEPERISEAFGGLRPVAWTKNGFYLTEENRCTKHPYYFAGLYYIQEPSAMSSAALLGTQPGERILDLCAAPGGKTTQIGADLQGTGTLIANDLSSSRAKALVKNIELMGIPNAFVCCEESTVLKREFPLFFDRILVDAPCSGEGMFRKHPAVIKAWLEHGKDFYCPVQKMLLEDAAMMLKPGGTLLYSTCTYNPHEDEDQIRGFLESHPDFSVDPIPAQNGLTASEALPGTVRLFPHKAEAEGHFVARLKKAGNSICAAEHISGRKKSGTSGLPGDMAQFFEKCTWRPDPDRILIQGEYAALLPDKKAYRPGLRYLKTGLLLGQLKNRRFRPSQALAMTLKKEWWADPVDIPSDDQDVLRYLRGETLESRGTGKGWRLLCTDGFPLGFVKQDGARLKNMYLPGWRMQ